MSDAASLISVVVPCFNEEACLPVFYERLAACVDKTNVRAEFIFVNDGSRDGTARILYELSERDPRVCALTFTRNFGSYAAIEAGFSHARGDAVMAISCDLQDPPELFERFVAEFKRGENVVWGVREARKDPWHKTLYAYIFYALVRRFIFPDFPKHGMDCGLFSRRVIDAYLQIQDRDSIPFFSIYWLGFPMKEVGYVREARFAGVGAWPFWKRVKCFIDILVGFSYMPLRMVSGMGVLMSAGGFLYAGAVLALGFLGHHTPGWTSIIGLVSIFSGTILMSIGILAEYVWRIASRVNGRPRFVVLGARGNDLGSVKPLFAAG